MAEYSRRSFLKGSALVGAAGAMGLAAGCGTSGAGGFEGYVPGDYTAEVSGHNAPFTVKVSFTKHALGDIDASGSQESLGVGKSAIGTLSHAIVKSQSLACDAVTGASITSAALLQGVKDCASQAGDTSELEAAAGPVDDVMDEYEADVCVVGGGGAGLAAAISAAQAGARVVVMEKCGILGGSTNVSEGALNAVDPERQEKQGIEDSVETFYEATLEGGHNEGTPELVHFLTDNALDSVHWMESVGVRFKDEVGSATGSLGQRSHYPATPYGNAYIRAFQRYIEDTGATVQIVDETAAQTLVTDASGAVTGVMGLHRSGKEVTVKAPAVVIATGGFGANVAYRQEVNTGVWKDVVLDDRIGCTNIKPCAQGDGLKLAEGAGAALTGLADIQLHPCGTPGTGLMEDIRTSGRNRIFVNKDGDRFVSEGAARDALCKAIFAQPESTYWVVVNVLRYPSPITPDRNGATIENMLAQKHIVAADTLEELAAATGMDPAKLKASIDAYNAIVDGSQEDEFGFKADNTADAQMTEGPWYACRKVPTVHHTMGGIKINVESQAVDDGGNPIAGLYACGECTGGIHGSNRLGGNAICDCMTFGRNAGKNAAEYAGATA